MTTLRTKAVHVHDTPLPTLKPALFVLACALLSGAQAALATGPLAVTAAPVGMPVTSRAQAVATQGYAEHEHLVSGQAQAYAPVGEWARDGRWAITPQDTRQPYTVRVLVRQPLDARKANGTVVIEWLNTSIGFDIDGIWALGHREFTREGYTWIGVSNEPKSVESLRKAQPQRYAALHVPRIDQAYDIFSQLGQLVRQPGNALLGKLPVQQVLAAGYSQSAVFLTTYLNAVQPVDKVFDGFFLQGRAVLGSAISSDQFLHFNPGIRTDLSVPVFVLQTEGEAVLSWPLSRLPDTSKVRYWEVAGAAHIDQFMTDEVQLTAVRDHGGQPVACLWPLNTMPLYEAANAAWYGLHQWVAKGTPPPLAPRMRRGHIGAIDNDAQGNALGGLRLPEMTVPVATHHTMLANVSTTWGVMNIFACAQGGKTSPFDPATLSKLYSGSQAYLTRYKAAADAALAAGFLRPADHADSLRRAQATARSLPTVTAGQP